MIRGSGNKEAIVTQEGTVTYGELKSSAEKFSETIQLTEGSRIAIFSENRLEWIYAFYAAWLKKCIPVPIDFMSSVDDVSFILNDCKPDIIFYSEDKAKDIEEISKKLGHSPQLVNFDKKLLVEGKTAPSANFNNAPNDTAVIIYTSGTTGSPKGVMLSYENLEVNINAISKDVNIFKEQDRVMMLLPLHHVFPLVGTLVAPLFLGSSIAMSPSLNADDIIHTLQQNKVSIIIGVPRLYSLIRKGIIDKINQKSLAKKLFLLAKKINSEKFSRFIFKSVHKKFGGAVKYLVSGGAALDTDVAIDFKTLGFEILEGYGMTEAAPMIAFTRPGDFKLGSAGKAVPNSKMEIREGEIVTSGKHIMQGYYGRPSETNDILKDGWLYTGDLGTIDENGYLEITGRKKEIIVLSNGKNINPIEIETKLQKISTEFKECGVFMHKDKLNVVIVPTPEVIFSMGEEKCHDYFRNNVVDKFNLQASSSKKIMKLYICKEELPKTRLGKLQRFKLAECALTNSSNKKPGDNQINSFKELDTLLGFLNEQQSETVHATDMLEDDLGLDSLAKVSLLVYIENTFGVTIKEENLANYKTVLQLAKHIQENKTRLTPESINWKKILKQKTPFKLPKPGISFNVFNFSYRTLLKSLFRLQIQGRDKIPYGPCIFAPNHQSFLDGFIIAALLRRTTMQRTYFYAKEKHWKKRWQKFLARKNNVILMDINKDLMVSIQKMAVVLSKGKNLIIFPEGTRSSTGELGEFKKTFAILANELDVPVVPVSINGANKAMPVGKKFPRLFRKVSVKFNDAIYPENKGTDYMLSEVRGILNQQLKAG